MSAATRSLTRARRDRLARSAIAWRLLAAPSRRQLLLRVGGGELDYSTWPKIAIEPAWPYN
jgi:hypothetical protein